ncbi:MAG: cytidylate kinase-like family protein [Magnetococcales bacterium]|nr:cytidylate kinase-like family protein [Magnetococcales bacterium]
MENNVRAVNALMGSVYFDPEISDQASQKKRPPLVTLSRSFGANGSKTAELLAKRLGVQCYGYTLLNAIVETLESNKHLTRLFDEKSVNTVENWLIPLLTQGKGSKNEYMRCLVKAVSAVAKGGGVIVGRGAHLILSLNPSVFRVRVEGSLEMCAKRIAAREGLDLDTAKVRVVQVDSERKDFVREIYQSFPSIRAYYDVVINSDHLQPEQMVDIIVFAMEERGLLEHSTKDHPMPTPTSEARMAVNLLSNPPNLEAFLMLSPF